MDVARPTGRRPRRLVGAFSSPDSYGLVLLLILVTYALSATITAAWAVSLVLVVQIATVWVTLRASRARRLARVIANAILVISAIAALVLIEHHWAVPLRDAIARAGGFRLSDGFISPLDLVAIGLVEAEEAEELHAMETAAAAKQ